MTLAYIQEESYRNSSEHGFWEGPENDNIPSKLALIHSEVSEALEDFRKGHMETETAWKAGPTTPPDAELRIDNDGGWVRQLYREWQPATDEVMTKLGFIGKPVGFPSELADIIIRVADLAGRLGIDLDAEIQRKFAFNRTRDRMHGGKRV